MRFWDASVVLPLCVTGSRTRALRRILDRDAEIVAWWATPVECLSGLARLRREGRLTPADEHHARRLVSHLAAEWTEIHPDLPVRDGAGRLLLRHPLRTGDALQLAAALLWAGGHPTGHEFVCLDDRLREAARSEGFAVLP